MLRSESDKLSSLKEGAYPIRVAIKLSGLTADTIRVWERRYQAVKPERSEGNTRFYSASEIRRLTKLKEATSRGHAIRKIARLGEAELDDLLAGDETSEKALTKTKFAQVADPHAQVIKDYLEVVRRFDVHRAKQVLTRSATLLPTMEFILQIVLPILRETGDLWHGRKISIAHEHLVSMQVRNLLIKMTDLVSSQPGAIKIVITTPEGHLHEFGALTGALIASARGFESIYLGPNLPEEDILLAVDLKSADILLLSVVRDMNRLELDAFSKMLTRLSRRIETWVGLPEGHAAVNCVAGVRFLTSFDEYELTLTKRVS